MQPSLRQRVQSRASNRCEYCHLPDFAAPVSSFLIEHIIAKQHGGSDDSENLARSCHRCNLQKGPNLSGILSPNISSGSTIPGANLGSATSSGSAPS